jgi:hypothetical protein
VEGNGLTICIRCGGGPRDNRTQGAWRAEPCRGLVGGCPARVRVALRRGRFDDALSKCNPGDKALVRALGWEG